MKPFFLAPLGMVVARCAGTALLLISFFTVAATSGVAATLTQQIDPPQVSVGDQATVTFTVQNGAVKKKDSSSIFGMIMPSVDFSLPQVDGLQTTVSSVQNISINGDSTTTVIFTLVPTHPGDFTIPAFDIPMEDGGVLHTKPMKLHVLATGTTAPGNGPAPVLPAPPPALNPPFNPHGPVVLPPNNPNTPDNGNAANPSGTEISVPRDKDGGPAKVFMIITPQTTDAYVGQSIPLQIDFFIRQDVYADQNSLPTIKGSDFLMNSFTTAGHGSEVGIENQDYVCETWTTAISAPKSGDFPLSMERDTYWVKSITSNNLDPFFGGIFNRHANLAHQSISSNLIMVHVHALPTEGRPAHFTGAIGQFKITGEAQPESVAVGEPVTLRYNISGQGNFDYVRCPVLPDDPAWKTYIPSSKTNYLDESHTHAVKIFEQSVIPKKNGIVALPPASFSYFDPDTKQYVTVPIALPEITVTGSAAPLAAAPAPDATVSPTAAVAPKTDGFLPNRLDVGTPHPKLTPLYRQTWFWAVQGGLILLLLAAGLFVFVRARSAPDAGRIERELGRRSLQHEEEAMAEAVRRDDALAFFVAARRVIQWQLGLQWKLKPEAVTISEIRRRDSHLAETLEPLYTQADEVIYSGQASPGLDLAQWEQQVRSALLQPQPA